MNLNLNLDHKSSFIGIDVTQQKGIYDKLILYKDQISFEELSLDTQLYTKSVKVSKSKHKSLIIIKGLERR